MSRTSDGTELVAVINPDGTNVGSGSGSSSNQTQGTAAAGATAVGNPNRVAGVTRPIANKQTRTNGQVADLTTDENENAWVRESYAPQAEDNTNNVIAMVKKFVAASTYTATRSTSFGTATKANILAAPGVPVSVYATNENAAVRYFQLHNKASAPAGTDVPLYSFPIPAGTANNPGTLILDQSWFENDFFTTGVGWSVGTTKATFTDSATASEHTVNVRAA